MKSSSIWQGMFLLSIATIIVKILSAFYRVPFQNMAGDVGFYVYQQVYPLYGIIVTIAMYGFPVVLSKERASLLAANKQREANERMSALFYGLLTFSFLLWVLLYFFAGGFAFLMGDTQLQVPIRAMSFTVFLLPFLSVARGYHQGNHELTPTAVSHVGDQLIRVLAILGFTYILVSNNASSYTIGSGAAYSSLLGGMIGFFLLLLMTKGASMKALIPPTQIQLRTFMSLNITLMKQSLFICLSALTLILFQLFDAFSLIHLLQIHGFPFSAAILQKGIFDRGLPIVQLGTVLTTTFSLALVPLLSSAIAKGDYVSANEYKQFTMKMTLLISGAATIGIIIIMPEMNTMLFTNMEGSSMLRLLALSIIFHSFFVTLTAISQAHKLERLPARSVCYGLIIKVGGNLLLVPLFGTSGAAFCTVIALFFMVIYLLVHLQKRELLFSFDRRAFMSIFSLFLILGIVAGCFKYMTILLLQPASRLAYTTIALLTVLIGVVAVAIGIIRLPIFTKEEWHELPFLNRIKR